MGRWHGWTIPARNGHIPLIVSGVIVGVLAAGLLVAGQALDRPRQP